MQPTEPPLVVIAMATRNGAAWLGPQLASIAAQDHRHWVLWVSDDGSTDATRALVAGFAADHPDHAIRLLDGPGQGAAQNFLALVTHPDIPATAYVALCDQDDVWLAGKLSRGLAQLAGISGPAVYGAQSLHIGPDGRVVGRSRRPRRPVRLRNAVVQNMVSGHSMILNPAAIALARRAGRPTGIGFHDWWLGLLVIAAGGQVVVDPATVLHYRQHAANVIGAPVGLAAQIRRIRLLFGRDYAGWIAANLAGLQAVDLTPEALAIVTDLRADLRAGPQAGWARVRALRRWRIHRQTGFGTMLLYLAALLGRV